MNADRITEHADWKDGINAFRLNIINQLDGIYEILDILSKEIETIKNNQKENPNEPLFTDKKSAIRL